MVRAWLLFFVSVKGKRRKIERGAVAVHDRPHALPLRNMNSIDDGPDKVAPDDRAEGIRALCATHSIGRDWRGARDAHDHLVVNYHASHTCPRRRLRCGTEHGREKAKKSQKVMGRTTCGNALSDNL